MTIELVDLAGREIKEDKRGYVEQSRPAILERLDIDASDWLVLTIKFEPRFRNLVGSYQKFKKPTQIKAIPSFM